MAVAGYMRSIQAINRRFGVMLEQMEKFSLEDVLFFAGSEGIKEVGSLSQKILPG
jgi:hypothetical protein